MKLKLIRSLPVKGSFKTPLIVGKSYLPKEEICFTQDGMITIGDLYMEFPDAFLVRDTQEVLEKTVVGLVQNYAYLHKFYGEPTEEFMSQKIAELSNKIISKL